MTNHRENNQLKWWEDLSKQAFDRAVSPLYALSEISCQSLCFRRSSMVILCFLIKAVGYVFGLIITVWHSAVCYGRKEAAPSHRFSLETLPGPHQRSPSFAPSFLPLPSLSSSIIRRFPSTLLPTAPGHA